MGKVVPNWENGKPGPDGSVLEGIKTSALQRVSSHPLSHIAVKGNLICGSWNWSESHTFVIHSYVHYNIQRVITENLLCATSWVS